MHLAETPEEQQAWMKQWRATAVALRKVRREELRALTDAQAIAGFNSLDTPPEFGYRSPERANSEGLIEQQRIFRKARRH